MGQPSIEKSAWSKQAMYKRRADTFRPYLLSLLQYSSLSDEVLQRNSFIIASRSVSFDPTSQYRLATLSAEDHHRNACGCQQRKHHACLHRCRSIRRSCIGTAVSRISCFRCDIRLQSIDGCLHLCGQLIDLLLRDLFVIHRLCQLAHHPVHRHDAV